jgi:hypothetical protein
MEWSVRRIVPEEVVGMWQDTHRLPEDSDPWWEWLATARTVFSWHGRHASFAFALSLNLYPPPRVWQWRQSSLPERAQGLMSQEV